MDKKYLFIGNVVMDSKGHGKIIVDINKDYLTTHEGEKFNLNHIHPYRLSKTWLLYFGFKLTVKNNFEYYVLNGVEFYNGGNNAFFHNSRVVHHVNTLQNIYFKKTGIMLKWDRVSFRKNKSNIRFSEKQSRKNISFKETN